MDVPGLIKDLQFEMTEMRARIFILENTIRALQDAMAHEQHASSDLH